MVLIPIHHPGHWALIVIQIGNKEIGYYDSLNNDGTKSLHKIWEFLDTESMSRLKCGLEDSKWTYTSHQGIPLQQNGYDCGVFTCQYAECLSRGSSFNFNQQYMSGFREQMVAEIKKGALY
uniref:Ubiquitin-like protease family profile domain-containing protein n=1 Tax=Ditylenchus dipsaci TaxID=166011 RepID=A0A915D2K6_9BILA